MTQGTDMSAPPTKRCNLSENSGNNLQHQPARNDASDTQQARSDDSDIHPAEPHARATDRAVMRLDRPAHGHGPPGFGGAA